MVIFHSVSEPYHGCSTSGLTLTKLIEMKQITEHTCEKHSLSHSIELKHIAENMCKAAEDILNLPLMS